jgi:hypothetical protein
MSWTAFPNNKELQPVTSHDSWLLCGIWPQETGSIEWPYAQGWCGSMSMRSRGKANLAGPEIQPTGARIGPGWRKNLMWPGRPGQKPGCNPLTFFLLKPGTRALDRAGSKNYGGKATHTHTHTYIYIYIYI